jgi:hypothetical protein
VLVWPDVLFTSNNAGQLLFKPRVLLQKRREGAVEPQHIGVLARGRLRADLFDLLLVAVQLTLSAGGERSGLERSESVPRYRSFTFRNPHPAKAG